LLFSLHWHIQFEPYIAAFSAGGVGLAVGPLAAVFLLAPRSTRNTVGKTRQAIECGMEPIGDAWIKFSAVYYLYALMFVAFAVDILFLFPVAIIYKATSVVSGLRAFAELFIFVVILSLVIVYAWKKGVFKWQRKAY
jgi:NADH-quinone oxidoreductase subunit A